MVWLVHKQNINDEDDDTISVWETEAAASKYVCSRIVDDINQNWNLSVKTHKDVATEIETLISQKDYQDAIDVWNIYSGAISLGICWNINYVPLYDDSSADEPDAINWPAPVATTTIAVPVATPAKFVATSPGATCRECLTDNEYAYADNPDGTFHCSACKGRKNIFT